MVEELIKNDGVPAKFVSRIEAALGEMDAYPAQHIDLFHHNDTDGLTAKVFEQEGTAVIRASMGGTAEADVDSGKFDY